MAKSSNSIKTAWDIIHEQTGKSKNHVNININVESNEKNIDNPNQIADSFNKYFIESVNNVVSKISHGDRGVVCNGVLNSMYVAPYDELEVQGLFMKLKNKSSAGSDDVPSNLLKKISYSIGRQFAYLINLSFFTGVFPNALKESSVTPIHKKGSKTLISNYRPIAISSSFSKIFEYAMLNRLILYLNKNNIFNANQHGYRANYSTLTAIHSLYDCIVKGLDSGRFSVGVFCDLSRAFDCVEWDMLLARLEGYGIRGVTAQWFETYLSGRSQFVSIKHKSGNHIKFVRSSSLPVKRGVPQGSILGPVLFIIYVNDMLNFVSDFNVSMYADDTSAIVCGSNISDTEDRTNVLLRDLTAWFNNNKLYLNADKTQYVVFHTIQNKCQFDLHLFSGCTEIKPVNEVRFLGLHIDAALTWRSHCDGLISKLNTACYQIRSLKEIIVFQSLLSFYYANVHSRLSYGITVWGASSACRDVFLAQKRIIRCIADIGRTISCRHYFKKWNILSVPSLHIYELLVYIFKNKDKLLRGSDIHAHDTRFRSNFHTPNCTLNLTKNSPRVLGSKLFNALPLRLKIMENEIIFKRSVKAFLLDEVIYSLEEYFRMCLP